MTDRQAPVEPKPAASLVLLRSRGGNRKFDVLMGRRPETARFMPGILVFPGGAVDPTDPETGAAMLSPGDMGRQLFRTADKALATALYWTALRETWEETGVLIGRQGCETRQNVPDCPAARAYLRSGFAPKAELTPYIARAITPSFMPMRFDTRFFMAFDENASGTPESTGELPEVLWIDVEDALADETVRGVSKFVLNHALTLLRDGIDLVDPERRIPCMTYEDSIRRIQEE